MKRWIFLTAYLCLLVGVGVSAPISKVNSVSVPQTRLRNVFGLPKKMGENTLFQSHILIFPQTKMINSIQDGKLIYFDNSADAFLPSSFGDDSLAVIEDKNYRQFIYSQFQVQQDLTSHSFRFIRETFPLGILSNNNKSFILRINQSNAFMNPLQDLGNSIKDTRAKTVVLAGILLESGIYTRYISSSRSLRIPLRKDYTIYAYTYEKIQGDMTRTLPAEIGATIQNVQKQNVVLKQQLEFRIIQNNKMNGHTPSDLYRKYGNLSFIKLGTWDHIERMDNYILTVTSTGTNGEKVSLQVPIEFY